MSKQIANTPEGVSTWESEAKRYYFDAKESFDLGYPATLIAGITYDKEEYAGEDLDNTAWLCNN